MKHAPTPYEVENEGQPSVGIYSIDNHLVAVLHGRETTAQDATANFIIRACNAHDDLVAALDALLSDINFSLHEIPPGAIGKIQIRNAQAALSKAKGEA